MHLTMKLLILCNDRLALPALNQLLQMKIIAGVGMTARQSEVQAVVHMMCNQYGVPLRLFKKATFAPDLEAWVRETGPDAVWVKTFPWKIPESVLSIPPSGFINFHYAPLPEYRGANPLFWMIRNGVAETGVTVHRMTAGIDEGPMLLSSKMPILPGATFGMIVAGLGFSGMELSGKLLQQMQAGTITEATQDDTQASWYDRPNPQDLWIEWSSMDAAAVQRLVNACNPWNKGAPARLNGWTIGLSYVSIVADEGGSKATPGTLLTVDEVKGLRIACKDNTVIRADVVFTEEGFLPGFALAGFGIRSGMAFM
ncbi:methionyl-tRNA formyltransferase [Taibaiella koreensis]|uniref:methionyl-tRNA formyltransferase n=1 Tax=Taibaiella koreensis TaxID=1268548 RepID=UPI000E59BD4E|nr:formyltransferase family protein [Taibaiella koreensis]